MSLAPLSRGLVAAVAVAGLLSVPVAATAASVVEGGSSGRPLSAELSGANEVDSNGATNVGDPNGSGTAAVTINVGQGELCYNVNFSLTGDAAPLFGHIHEGDAGTNGDVVVTLAAVAGADGTAAGCATVSRDLLREILRDPSGYYVNIHSPEFQPGAIRGQLGK